MKEIKASEFSMCCIDTIPPLKISASFKAYSTPELILYLKRAKEGVSSRQKNIFK